MPHFKIANYNKDIGGHYFECHAFSGKIDFVYFPANSVCKAYGLDYSTATDEQLQALIGEEFDVSWVETTHVLPMTPIRPTLKAYEYKKAECPVCERRLCGCGNKGA